MKVNKSIFRENDIRGIYPDQLNEDSIAIIGKAISHKCRSKGISSISIGRDGRLSGKSLLNSFCESLVNAGLDVTKCGLVTSPMLYFEAKTNESKSGIIITGSHNPKNHNGLKMVINDKPMSGLEILSLIDELQDNWLLGSLVDKDIKENYLSAVVESIDIKGDKKFKIVLDSGNGVAGSIAPDLIRRIGCEVIELYSDVDGTFLTITLILVKKKIFKI